MSDSDDATIPQRATASDADEDEALYGEEETEHGDEAEIGVSLPH